MRWLSFSLVIFLCWASSLKALSWDKTLASASRRIVTIIAQQVKADYLWGQDLPQGVGTGFVVDQSGYVLAPALLVRKAKWIEAVLPDGSHCGATLIGIDYFSEVALLKLKTSAKLRPLPFSHQRPMVGEEVALISRPRCRLAVAMGCIEEWPTAIRHQGFLVPDMIAANLSLARTGQGPVINLRGEVIGLAIDLPNFRYNRGLYLVPANRLKRAYQMLKENQEAVWPWLGVRVQAITPPLAKALRLPVSQGAMVVEVYRGSPAAKVGFHGGRRLLSVGNLIYQVGGDIITSIDGQVVRSEYDLSRIILNKEASDEIQIIYYRGKRRGSVKLHLGRRMFIQP